MQGGTVAKPYTDKARVSFPVAVDTADVFGQAFGLKAIPVSYLVDEVGIVRLSGGGPGGEFLKQVEALLAEPLAKVRSRPPRLAAGRSRAELEKAVEDRPADWQSHLALAQLDADAGRGSNALARCETAARLQPKEAAVHFTWGQVLLRLERRDDALTQLKQARDLDPANWRIRKQIWAIEHPDKFYSGHSPDFGWQKEELAREKAARRE